MGYVQNYALSVDEQMIRKVTAALADVADDVFAEPDTTPEHALRMALVAYAGPVRSSYRRFAEEITLQLITTTNVNLNSTDEQIKTALATLWTPYAQLMKARGVITTGT